MEVNNARFNEKADESQANAQKSDDHKKLIEYGIHELVADRLDEIYKSGKMVKHLIKYNHSFYVLVSLRNMSFNLEILFLRVHK